MAKRMMKYKREYMLGVTIATVLLFFAPLDFFYSNRADVWYDVYNILPSVLMVSILGALAVIFLGVILRNVPKVGKKLGDGYSFVIFYLLVAFYIQGNFIKIPYGALVGIPIVWSDYRSDDVLSVVIWCLVLSTLLVAYKRLGDRFHLVEKTIEVALLFIAIFTLGMEFLVLDGGRAKFEKQSTNKNEWTYSSDENFNILVLDSFDSRVFKDLVSKDDDFREKVEVLDGFTLYEDTLGCYNLTDYSVPVILTGQLYLNQSTYGEFVDKAYSESELLNRLSEDGWSQNIYVPITLPQDDKVVFDNAYRIRMTSIYEKKFLMDMYKTVAFRYMPTPLKHFFYESFFEVGANKIADNSQSESTEAAFDWDNVRWNNGHLENGFEIVDDKMFHYYHLQGIHPPRQYHSNFDFTTNPEEVSLEESMILNMTIICRWIEHLKECGLYDNSIIVIMGDHGAWEYEAENNVAQTPLLMIKGMNENHEFVVNTMPVSYLDLQEGYLELIDGRKSYDLFDSVKAMYADGEKKDFAINLEEFCEEDRAIEPVGRWRVFFFTYLMNEMKTDSDGGKFFELLTEYPSYYGNGMVDTKKEY